jgi:hypothetical protein
MEYFVYTTDNHDFAVDADAITQLEITSVTNAHTVKNDYITLESKDVSSGQSTIVAILNMSFIKAIVAANHLNDIMPDIDYGDDDVKDSDI